MRIWQFFCLLVLFGLTPARADSFLDPAQAFVYSAHMTDASHISVSWKIADKCYLYRDKLQFAVHGATAGKPDIPPGEVRNDPVLGQETIFHHQLTVVVPVTRRGHDPITLDVTAQGCSEQGICYAPMHYHSQFGDSAASPAAAVPVNASPGRIAPTATATRSPAGISASLGSGSLWTILATFFGAGLLLSLTPCVFPMIPILSGIIVGQNHHSRLGSFLLSLAYVAGMAITYTLAGIAAALSGTLLSNSLQSPLVLGTVAVLFVLLSLSMFGLYELQLPASLQTRFTGLSNRFQGGHLLGTFFMGALSALIVGPCVAPPLAAALTWIARTGNVWLGGSALFSLAIGMGAPLLLIGLTSGAILPRAGAWMNGIRQLFGVLMLGMAIWLVGPLLAMQLQMLLWAALLILSGVAWQAIDPLPPHATGWQRLWKGLALILLIVGISLLLGALTGAQSITQPLSAFAANRNQPVVAAAPQFIVVHSEAELQQQLAQADARPTLLDFYADWCVSCREMDTTTLQDPRVEKALSGFRLLRADLTANSIDEEALRKRFAVFGPPVLLRLDAQGHELGAPLVGLQSPTVLLDFLSRPAAS